MNDVIERYMKDVDMSSDRENLKLIPEECKLKLQANLNFILELRTNSEPKLMQKRVKE